MNIRLLSQRTKPKTSLKFELNIKQKMSFHDSNSFQSAAIVCNTKISTDIGLDILKKGGSAADAAIAVMLSEGVCCPQSSGIGGGFLMTIYNKSKNTCEVLNSRECAPAKANKNMFTINRNRDISCGGLAVAVPAEIKGMWELHRKYGKLDWKDLFSPTIKQCRTGIKITKYTSHSLKRLKQVIENSPTLSELFINKKTGNLYKEGDVMVRDILANTLTAIALKGPDALYNGELTDRFVKDIEDYGGLITKDDLKNYRPFFQDPVYLRLDNSTIYSPPPPGGGSVLLTIIDALSRVITSDQNLLWHRLVEIWKFSFAMKSRIAAPAMGNQRVTYKNDFANYIIKNINDSKTYQEIAHYTTSFKASEDAGTCHICVLAENGDAISVTTSINDGLGAAFLSVSTGIILNNQMMDFSIPCYYPWELNPSNYIEPNKQPLSSMCPTIVVDNLSKQIRLLLGGAGGFRIITSTSQVIARKLLMNVSLLEAVASPRLHHQLVPMRVEFEDNFEDHILKDLKRKGHMLRQIKTMLRLDDEVVVPILPGVNAISIDGTLIYAIGDPRRFACGNGY